MVDEYLDGLKYYKMNICKLCLAKNADKRGSHIVPHFLLKRIENVDGKKQRDYELGFRLDKMGMTPHFGRAVSPEKLEQMFGDLTDAEIENNQHPLIVDHYYCSDCEQRLSIIESSYAITLNEKLDNPEEDAMYDSGADVLVALLFWTSVVWRISSHGKSGVRLNASKEEYLRGLLNKYLPQKNIEDLKSIEDLNDFVNISYKAIRFSSIKESDAKYLFVDPKFSELFVLLIDEYVIALAIGCDYSELENEKSLGLNLQFDNVIVNEVKENTREVIKKQPKIFYLDLCKNLVDLAKDVYLEGLDKLLDELHKILGGEGNYMPIELKMEVKKALIEKDNAMGRKYTIDDLKETLLEIFGEKN